MHVDSVCAAARVVVVWWLDSLLLIHLSDGVLVATISLLMSPPSAMTPTALELRATLLLTFVLSLLPLDVFALLASVPVHAVDFHWRFSH